MHTYIYDCHDGYVYLTAAMPTYTPQYLNILTSNQMSPLFTGSKAVSKLPYVIGTQNTDRDMCIYQVLRLFYRTQNVTGFTII